MNIGTVNWILNQLLNTSAVRPTKHMTADMAAPQRTEIMQGHGLRKFFDTTCTNAGVNPVYIEFLMGHSMGLKSRYAKPTPLDLLEGNDKNLGYISAIDALTIDDSNRLKTKVRTLESEKSQISEMEGRISKLQSLVEDLMFDPPVRVTRDQLSRNK